jgi:type I restriction-modification system DNA methylase subunit
MAIRKEKVSPDRMVRKYLEDIITRYKDGTNATEHTHRPALQNLLEQLLEDVLATNEPQRIDCGAPDFILTKGNIPVGYIEAKDLDEDLDDHENSEQLTRYFGSLDNLILTNYLEFRWYVKGKLRSKCSIGSLNKKKISFEDSNFETFVTLVESFCRIEIPTIKSAPELAERLAGTTKTICQLIAKAYEFEDDKGYLHKWLNGFKTTLIADLEVQRFADMFAQTLVYGYFSARANQNERTGFSRESAARILPETNPFLKRLFHEFIGIDMPKSIDWAVDEVVEILKRTDMKAVLKDFGGKSGKNDPIFHFYETFLEKYDPELKDALGAYYTPQPVINYIVKSVDHVLQKHFSRRNGLADQNTLILDPAVGTGSFLFHAIEQIRDHMKGQEGTWPQYVAGNLLNRIFGFEIMMAPYAIAHLKIGNQLKDTGYKFNSGTRLGIYLTNTLEEAAKKTDTLLTEFISDEANEAASIKSDKPIVAIIGNPPYKGFAQNHGKWIQSLMEDYKDELGEKKSNSDNDYMKFIRFAQWRIDRTGFGVAAFITPNSYLDAITLRQMRASLLKSFSDIYVLNLHGSAMVENAAGKELKDKNVFDIRQGVSISVFVRNETKADECNVYYSEVIGPRESKYEFLDNNSIATTTWKKLNHSKDRNFFSPLSLKKDDEYLSFLSIKDIFPIGTSGIQPKKKDIAIQFSRSDMEQIISDFANFSQAEVIKKYDLGEDSAGWKVPWAQDHAKQMLKNKQTPTCIQYRTFDYRWTVIEDYSSGIVGRPRYDVMKHMKRPNNLGLIVLRQLSQSSFQHAWVSRHPIDENTISRKTREYNYIFPLFLEPEPDQLTTHQQRLNISQKAQEEIKKNFDLHLTQGLHGDFVKTISPEQFFYYIYAILHSPHYREKFFSELKIDFPRIPMFQNKTLIKELSEIGQQLASLHLMENEKQTKPNVLFKNKGSNIVKSLKFKESENELWINESQCFSNLSKEAWTFKIGGHEVVREFFTDREDRELTSEEVENVRKMIVAVEETIPLMAKIDSLIISEAGWTLIPKTSVPKSKTKTNKKSKVA